ncbi:hypothetical protein [Streptomyces fodineus]|uniref:hypothetical protein n=1 Tax=Streptomyces fodineus TaxID=1904616 RepID=UPI000ADC162F|nr:hypothetical protein [Streptomyces fodineus]
MQIADLAEHTRLLGEVSPALNDLYAEVEQVREGEIAKPVREIAPICLRVQELAMQCTRQFHDLSVSQYAAMKGGEENLAHLASACSQISLAATLCNPAIHHRTEILLYEDADPTPAASRDQLPRAGDEMKRAATTYRAVAQQLSRRLASVAARNEDQQLIAHALADEPERASAGIAGSPACAGPGPPTTARGPV